MKNMKKTFIILICILSALIVVAGYAWSANRNLKLKDTNNYLTKTTKQDISQSKCATNMVEFVQITSMQLDAGEQTFEAFRILRDGMVEWARWNSSGYLLEHAEPRNMGSGTFDKLVSTQSFLNPPKPHFMDDGTVGRPSSNLQVTTVSKSGIDTIEMIRTPDDIATFIDNLRRSVKATPVQPGWYVWTVPYTRNDVVDIDLATGKCDSAVAMALSEAVTTGRLIVRADNNVQEFISGEKAFRSAFGARISIGDMLFGVIRPRSN